MSQNVVEFNIVNFISCFRLESLVNESELLLTCLQLHVVKYRAETTHANEASARLVFVLEERLKQEAVVSDVSAKTN